MLQQAPPGVSHAYIPQLPRNAKVLAFTCLSQQCKLQAHKRALVAIRLLQDRRQSNSAAFAIAGQSLVEPKSDRLIRHSMIPQLSAVNLGFLIGMSSQTRGSLLILVPMASMYFIFIVLIHGLTLQQE